MNTIHPSGKSNPIKVTILSTSSPCILQVSEDNHMFSLFVINLNANIILVRLEFI